MTQIALPERLCVQIANDATTLAQLYAPKKTGAGAKGLYPISGKGEYGVGIAKWAYYMYYQDQGIDPFIMWSLEGKLIPMNIGGRTIFRYARGVGDHQISARDKKTGQIVAGNKPIKWRHPGLKPKHFIEQGMEEALRYHMTDIMEFAFQSVVSGAVKEGLKRGV